jgi:two-component system, NarL family, nitrate/nitrite response regulator NarL
MNSQPRVRIVLADDHPVVLSGLKALIQSEPWFEVVAACDDGVSALRAIRRLGPELAVLDVRMPGLTGIDVVIALKGERSATRAVLLTASATDEQILAAVSMGVAGLLMKDTAADQLLQCLRAVAEGRPWLSPELVHAAQLRNAQRQDDASRWEAALTARERQLVQLVAEGLSNKLIARELGVSDGTVKIHLYNVYRKLGVGNRTTLAAMAFRHAAPH